MAQAGGNGAILARGDVTAGSVLIVCRERGTLTALLERVWHGERYELARVGPRLDTDTAESDATDWIDRRLSRDPDLWVVELDIAESERFAAGIASDG